MNENIDWEEVESKISLICYKFDNLAPWREDLAQELRIHAYYVSDNYYDLYRRAIDFWRKIQSHQSPEIPYFDLDVLGDSYAEDETMYQFDELVKLIKIELARPGYDKWDSKMLDVANQIFSIILEDIDPRIIEHRELNKSSLSHYNNKRINLSWLSEETGIGYKRLIVAMKFLEDIVRGLCAMKKIELPAEYFYGYYEKY